MTSDLERDLQLALRMGVEHVTPERLRHDGWTPGEQSTHRRGRWTITGPMLAAACVAVLAFTITVVATHRNGGNAQTTTARPQQIPSLVGTSWLLVSVRHGGTATSVPQQLGASVTFEEDGVLSAQDGLNVYRGKYTTSGLNMLRVQGGTASAAGYAGRDPSRLAAISGVGALRRHPPAHHARLHPHADPPGADGHLVGGGAARVRHRALNLQPKPSSRWEDSWRFAAGRRSGLVRRAPISDLPPRAIRAARA